MAQASASTMGLLQPDINKVKNHVFQVFQVLKVILFAKVEEYNLWWTLEILCQCKDDKLIYGTIKLKIFKS